MTSDFAGRFQAKYSTLSEAWWQFAWGEVPETFPPEWRGVNYYASVFSNDTDPQLKAAAQAFLSALDAAKYDARTYIARLAQATQIFARAVCQGAGIKWKPTSPPLTGSGLARPGAAEKRNSALGRAADGPKLSVSKTPNPELMRESVPRASAASSSTKQAAGRQRTKTPVKKRVEAAIQTKPAKGVPARKSATGTKPVKSKASAPKATRKPRATKPGTQSAGRNGRQFPPAPKPVVSRKPAKKPQKTQRISRKWLTAKEHKA